jgi:diguanylate cyclase (GGDEF)-like protein
MAIQRQAVFFQRLHSLIPKYDNTMEFPFNEFPDAWIVLDASGKILGINPAGEKLLKLSASEAAGKSLSEVCSASVVSVGEPGHVDRLAGFGEIKIRSVQSPDGDVLGQLAILRGLRSSAQEEALRRQNEMLVALQETTFDLHSSLDLKVVLRNIVERACKLLGTAHGYVLVEQEAGELEPVVGLGALEEMLGFKVTFGEGIAGIVWKTARPLFVPDYDQWPGRLSDFPRGWIRSVLGMPLILNGHVIGVIGIAKGADSLESFSEEEGAVLARFASLAVLALQNARVFQQARAEIAVRRKMEIDLRNANQALQFQLESIERLQEQLENQAVRDSLTDLFNRRYLRATLEVELARAKRSKTTLAILMMDCDRLKYINDVYGHISGDDALVRIANVIREFTRAGDIACRYGGDEFVVVLGNVSEETAVERAESLRDKIAGDPILHKGEKVSFSVSIGIAMCPSHGEQGEILLQKADQALYEAKHRGKNRVLVYNHELK